VKYGENKSKRKEAMLSYSIFDREITAEGMSTSAPVNRYAWLEHEGGMWHFLTDLFADPVKSTRRWSDKQLALEELMQEGWTVVYPYPEQFHAQRHSSDRACGYGLMWVDQ
jgi:hypothetical protein